jgi:DNA-binding transcriptional ArsR family regulator
VINERGLGIESGATVATLDALVCLGKVCTNILCQMLQQIMTTKATLSQALKRTRRTGKLTYNINMLRMLGDDMIL